MQAAAEDLALDNLIVIYPGKDNYPLAKAIRAIGLENYIGIK
jgi:hypothetical protein